MYCSFCGKDIIKAQKYCRSCGSYLLTRDTTKTGGAREPWFGATSCHGLRSLLIGWFIQIGSNLVVLILVRRLEDADLGILSFLALSRVPLLVVLAAFPLAALTGACSLRLMPGRSIHQGKCVTGPDPDQVLTRRFFKQRS